MYAGYFGLRELPFNNTPDPRFFFPTPDHEEALASLVYAVKGRKGFVLLTGEVGAGKTLVSRLMLRKLGAGITFANISHGVAGARDLMESVCAELELKTPERATLTQLTRVLHDFLLARFAQNIPVVLVLDEAQNLPIGAFEQLRMIGNLEADDAKLLQIAIVGQPELQGMFASPALRQLRQRIFRSFHLPALDRGATAAYIAHRLRVAGGDGRNVFTDDAVDRIYDVAHGLPRIINTTCDNALLSAYSVDRADIDGPFIDSVCEHMTSESSGHPIEPHGPWHPQPLPNTHTDRTARPAIGHDAGHAEPSPELDALGARMTRLEGLLAHSTSIPRTPQSTLVAAAVDAPVVPAHDELLGRLNRLSNRIITLERNLHLTPQAIADARALVGSLEPLVQRAEAAVTHVQSASSDLRRRDQKLQSAAATVATILDRMNALLTRCEQAAADMRRQQEHSAAMCRRMQEQSRRAQQLADGVSHAIERTLDRKQVERSSVPTARDPEPWKDILHGARDSLQQLRELARRTAQRPPAIRTPPPAPKDAANPSAAQPNQSAPPSDVRTAAGPLDRPPPNGV
jgi:type II secretory pathway predicted ATPase ExeA